MYQRKNDYFDGYKHTIINYSKIIAERKNDLNGLENFCGWSKSRLQKFKGINRNNVYLHLKGCEFRFNHRNVDLAKKVLQFIKA